ncbi:hypothetical protein VCHA57P526_390001 [Vibrio chagasii]|nr:hypothetical protein VCHA35P150_140143 [Vibrio chagasii]CAH7240608.1 hypothetical protein VCHA40O231_430002 [Vibrio chagasii]CAH7266095.1 hypothetical protein VCHA38O206_300037 [Vibrio chagasii]CAH7384204.1 hypothetical protein VCHA57P526_390001 [Vibrio chagasii]CAH7455053.1 hypothetical protein VCHA37O177_520002 [Vibrio chagasii]
MKFKIILEDHSDVDEIYETKFDDHLSLPVAYNLVIKSEARKQGINLDETDLVKIKVDEKFEHHVSFYVVE